MTKTIARGAAYVALVLSLIPVVSVVAYALLPPTVFTTSRAANVAMLTYLSVTPVSAGLAIFLGRDNRARAGWALGLWVLVIAFFIYALGFRG